MTETTISGGGGTGGVYTPPPADDQVEAPKTAGVSKPQADAPLTVSHQQGDNTANLASNQIGSDDLEPPMTMGDMSLAVTMLFADLNQTRANQNVDMLKDAGKEIKDSNKHRLEQIAHNLKLIAEQKHKKKGALIGEICGIVGGILIAAASLGTLSEVGVAMVVTSVAISTAVQVTQMAGGFEQLAKETDQKTADGIMYGLLAVSVVLGAGAGAANALKTAPEVAESLAQTAAETGMAMSEAGSASEGMEILMQGVQKMTTTLEQAGVEVDQAAVEAEVAAAFSSDASELAETGANVAETGVVDDAAAQASDVTQIADKTDDVAKTADTADDLAEGIDDTGDAVQQAKTQEQPKAGDPNSDESVEGEITEEGPSTYEKIAKVGHRAGRLMEAGGSAEQGKTKIDVSEIEGEKDKAQAEIQRDDAYIQFERSSMSDGSENNKNTLDALSSSYQYMSHMNNSFRKQGATPIGAIGRDGAA